MTTTAAHILILDPDPVRRDALSHQLADLGYAVTTAESVQAGAQAASGRTVALIVAEGSLPVASFSDLLNIESLRAAQVLLVAGDDDEIKDRLSYAADVLRRPFDLTLLKLRLDLLLKLSGRADELRLERDLQIARDIQRGFLPAELPQLNGWQIAARFIPAYEVAGDFYDAFYLTNKVRTGFVVADVCDKGIGAALFMGLARSLLRAFAQQNYTVNWAAVIGTDTLGRRGEKLGKAGVGVTALKNAVTLTNNYIANNHGESNMFATLFFGLLDPATGAVHYVNAGHNPPLVIGGDGTIKARLTRTGIAVGMFPDVEFGIGEAQLDPGETLLVFTDGVTEAKNGQDQVFSDERLEGLIASAPPSTEGLLNHIQAAIKDHVGDARQSDDITMLAIRRDTGPV